MFVVATATFRLLYALIVLSHERRRVIHFECHRKSDASPGFAPNHRGLSLGHRAPLSAARPRHIIWSDLPRSSPAGHRGGRHRTSDTVAEPLCGAPHRFGPPRMLGSHNHLQRASLAPCPVEIFSISSRGQNTSLAQQGLSAASPHTATLRRRDHRVPRGGWSASSLRTSRRMKRSADRRAAT